MYTEETGNIKDGREDLNNKDALELLAQDAGYGGDKAQAQWGGGDFVKNFR